MAEFTHPINIRDIHRTSIYISWSQKTVGFGQLSVGYRNGSFGVDSEGMSKEWTRKALYALADKIIEEAFDEEGQER